MDQDFWVPWAGKIDEGTGRCGDGLTCGHCLENESDDHQKIALELQIQFDWGACWDGKGRASKFGFGNILVGFNGKSDFVFMRKEGWIAFWV